MCQHRANRYCWVSWTLMQKNLLQIFFWKDLYTDERKTKSPPSGHDLNHSTTHSFALCSSSLESKF